MRRPRPLATTRAIIRNLIVYRRAVRTYRQLCDQGRAPLVQVEIRLITDRADDWTGMTVHGIYGIKYTTLLTRAGIRAITDDARTIRRTCIRQILADQTEDPNRTPVDN